MSVKKTYSDFRAKELQKIQDLQAQIDKLNSYNDSDFIAQRDIFNKKQKEDWNRKKRNFQAYSEEYSRLEKTIKNESEELFRSFLLHKSIQYNLHEISEQEPNQLDMIFGRIDSDTYIPPNPKNIILPEEPTPIVDLQRFNEAVKEQIIELEKEIEILRADTSRLVSISQREPFLLNDDFWLYQDKVYEVKGGHSNEEKKLLVLEFADRDRRKFERLKNKFSGEKSDEMKYERIRIPEEVRIAVWRRDQGRCARCGSRENLEYDHIVPVSKGGGNTERNIELLCQNCNRSKSNNIE
jgi:hypothetical protein